MEVELRKVEGCWCMIIKDCDPIRTPYRAHMDRRDVVSYAQRAYPDAKIIER